MRGVSVLCVSARLFSAAAVTSYVASLPCSQYAWFVYIQVVQELDDEFKACSALLDDMKSEFKWVPTDEKGIWREVCVRDGWHKLASSPCCTCTLLGSRFD